MLLCSCAAPRAELERFEYSRLAMGVEARIVLHAPDEDSALAAARAAFGRIEELEQALSDWREHSELSRLCARAGGGPVPISPDLLAALSLALRWAEASEGALDPTVGPLTLLWRRSRARGELPEPAELEAARALVDWRLLVLDPRRMTAELRRAGMRLDLGAIGKGLACDAALATLRAQGIESALVELGGDLAVSAAPPGRAGWTVELEADLEGNPGSDPVAGTVAGPVAWRAAGAPRERRRLAHAAVAASGDTQQFVELGGVRYSHVVDPRTGLGLTQRLRVTVIAPDAAMADALATAVGVLGRQRGREFARRFPACEVRLAVAGD